MIKQTCKKRKKELQMTPKKTKAFIKWFDNLPNNVQDEVVIYINRVLVGNTSNCNPLRKGISEIKINYQKGYRVYYSVLQNNVILLLLYGGYKDSQAEDIKVAIEIKEYLKKSGTI
ncbi:MAG: hypothetical protein LBN20_04895 [Endomicrobium sp.]|jgi:putative addiction module killer protein|nr:hypothetical protein [Endomicrobium sp.]